jgi:hypothetical protein
MSNHRRALLGAATILSLAVGRAEARIVDLRLDRVEPLADGASLGPAGAYERAIGIAHGELDPAAPANRGIAGLDRAPRNTRGLVEYQVDVFLLRPADPAKRNGKIFYDIVNRNLKLALPWLNDAPETTPASNNDPKTGADVGTGFLFRDGWTIAWSGWDGTASPNLNGMTAALPVATIDGTRIVGRSREEFVFGTRLPPSLPGGPLTYEAATMEQGMARLTVRRRQAEPETLIPSERWAYAGPRMVKLLPEATAFEPGAIYEFSYPAQGPKVLGIGFAAVRDVVSALRHDRSDPARTVIGLGISQSARFARQFLEMGMNRDESGARVFDGLMMHIGGAGKVFVNEAFAQPGRTRTQHEDHDYPEAWFPFSTAAATDPLSGQRASVLQGDGSDPLIFEVNTSSEYWQKGASLVHTDPAGRRDLPLPPNVRAYLIAGTQHAHVASLVKGQGLCAAERNPHIPSAGLRALVAALDAWVSEGRSPPPSRIPTLRQGTLVDAADLRFPAVPGLRSPARANEVPVPDDWRVVAAPRSTPYGAKVGTVDADGNEVAGIHLPDLAVPLGTHTGWNFYRDKAMAGEFCDRDGAFVPFARTRAERLAAGDSRPSLEERYGSRAAYVAAVERAVDRLVRDRLLLPEDAAGYVERAAKTRVLD